MTNNRSITELLGNERSQEIRDAHAAVVAAEVDYEGFSYTTWDADITSAERAESRAELRAVCVAARRLWSVALYGEVSVAAFEAHTLAYEARQAAERAL